MPGCAGVWYALKPGGGGGMPAPGGGPIIWPGPPGGSGAGWAKAAKLKGRYSGRALFFLACAARSLSAGVPCRSPVLESFLSAYEMVMGRLRRCWLESDSMAASDASKESKEMKPKLREAPVVSSRATCCRRGKRDRRGQWCKGSCPASHLADRLRTFGRPTTFPNALNVSYSILSSTVESRLPTKRLAPMSICFRSELALFTRNGLPNSLMPLRILHAYSASASVWNSAKPYPWCVEVIRSFGTTDAVRPEEKLFSFPTPTHNAR